MKFYNKRPRYSGVYIVTDDIDGDSDIEYAIVF